MLFQLLVPVMSMLFLFFGVEWIIYKYISRKGWLPLAITSEVWFTIKYGNDN